MTTIPTRDGVLTSTSSSTVAASVSLTGIADGSWMVAVLVSVSGIASAPAGWTSLLPSQAIGTRAFAVCAKIKGSGDSTFSWNGTASSYKRLVVVYGSGADAVANWIKGMAGVRNASNAVGGQSQQAGTSTTSVAPSVTTTIPNSLVIDVLVEATTNVGTTPTISGTGHTYIGRYGDADTSYIEQVVLAYREMATAGASGAATATFNQTQANNGGGIQIVLPPTPDAPPPEEEGFPAVDGNGQEVRVFWIDAEGDPRTPAGMVFVPRGYRSVDDMMNDREEFFWAHRGGSASWPEHSLHAYTQSVIRGFGALEISLGRTSDGVWIGLHDENINRSSGLAAGTLPAVSSMTWAQVQAYQITIGAAGAPQPYMRWEDLIEAYGDTHVIVADPKHQIGVPSAMAEFWSMLVNDLNPDRVVAKYFYDSTAFKTQADALGLASWGYVYESNLSDPSLSSRLAGWTMLGMEYGASQSAWDTVLAANPYVVAHICPNEAAVTAGRTKGARAFQCSGTGVISPDNGPRLA